MKNFYQTKQGDYHAVVLSCGLRLGVLFGGLGLGGLSLATDTLYQIDETKSANASEQVFYRDLNQSFAECLSNFADKPPALAGEKGQKLNQSLYVLCFDGFATLYSGVSLTPLWSASHLTKERVLTARTLDRLDNFRAESRLPPQARVELIDYRQSGYDRGHIAPNGDMATASQQYDSFSLANIAPQNREQNRHLWRQIEITTRSLAVRYGQVYVVTGVAFTEPKIARLNGRVFVPSHFFKAIYVPSIQKAGVYFAANDASGDYQVISLQELTNRTGIVAMPSLPASIQNTAYRLPKPMSDENDQLILLDGDWTDWLWLLIQILQQFVTWLNRAD